MQNYIVGNKVLTHFSLYKFRTHNAVVKTSYKLQDNENVTYQKK